MFAALRRWFGLRMVRSNPQPARRLLGRYDAALTTTENRKHWANADALGAREANSPSVRRVLRMRSRYEVANNCYAAGIVRTLAASVIGTGPRLQMQTNNPAFNEAVEREFRRWAKKVRLAAQLRLAREAQAVDGEAFIQLVTNQAIEDRMRRSPRLDLRLVEAEQVSTPNLQPGQVDGIEFDADGNPRVYHVLKGHPGEYGSTNEKTDVPAAEMIHLFRRLRPGQVRGIPETTPGLPLFAMMRRYTLAVVTAAEVAASMAGVIQTDQRSDEEGADATPYDQIEIERGMWTVMPDGWKANQFKPEQPTSTHQAFQAAMINEIGRPWSMPKNIAMCDSSGYNYASGRLDHQTYFKFVDVDRSDIEIAVLDRIFAAWLDEALLVNEFLPPFQGDPDHDWYWDGSEHVDPSKEANAQQTRLASMTTTLAAEYAKEGKDWETELAQIAKEREAMKAMGLEMPAQATGVVSPADEDGGPGVAAMSLRRGVRADDYVRDEQGQFAPTEGGSAAAAIADARKNLEDTEERIDAERAAMEERHVDEEQELIDRLLEESPEDESDFESRMDDLDDEIRDKFEPSPETQAARDAEDAARDGEDAARDGEDDEAKDIEIEEKRAEEDDREITKQQKAARKEARQKWRKETKEHENRERKEMRKLERQQQREAEANEDRWGAQYEEAERRLEEAVASERATRSTLPTN